MNYCVNYNKDADYLKYADEVDIPYKQDCLELLSLLKKYPTIRVNICILQIPEENQDALIDLITKNKDYEIYIKFGMADIDNDNFIKKLKEHFIPYFFAVGANNWDIFYGLLELNPSDISIVENLGFDLEKVAEEAHKRGVRVRAFPNVAQSSWFGGSSLTKFFIRPEDVEFYSQYIDTLDFFTSNGNFDNDKVLLEVYKDTGYWYGPLKEIIIGLNSEIDSRGVIDQFAESRINCRKKCSRDPDSCHICHHIEELADSLVKNGLYKNFKKEDTRTIEEIQTDIIKRLKHNKEE